MSYNITLSDETATISPNVSDGGSTDFVVTAKTGYKLIKVRYIIGGRPTTIDSVDGVSCSFTVNITNNLNITVTTEQLTLYNITLNTDFASIVPDSVPAGIHSFTVTANEGYKLIQTSYISGGRPVITESSDGKTTTFDMDVTDRDIVVLCKIEVEVPPENVSTFINVYRVTDSELDLLAEKRFIDNTTTMDIVDAGVYINSLYMIPFTIPDDVVIPDTMKLGKYTLDITTNLVKKYEIDFNVGDVTIPNYVDLNTKFKLVLPYGTLEIPYHILNNKTINFKYRLNLYNGIGVIMVYENNSMIDSYDINVKNDIPFSFQSGSNIYKPSEIKVYNDVTIPYIEVTTSDKIYNDRYDCYFIDDFNKLTGYNEITDIKGEINCTKYEYDMLLNILNGGVEICISM